MSRRAARVFYVQYMNPASYPPLDHSVQLLAAAGADVLVMGTADPATPLRMPAHPRVQVDLTPTAAAGWRQKAHYLAFAARAIAAARRMRPDWTYVSDPISAPIGLALRRATGTRVVYHEHDSPDAARPAAGWFQQRVESARRALARTADLCVVPNADRAEALRRTTGREDVLTVWNTPLKSEVSPPRERPEGRRLRVLYQGSIVPARVPIALLQAFSRLRDDATLLLLGYATAGHADYIQELRRAAEAAGVERRVEFGGVVERREMLARSADATIGLALFPTSTADVNERSMLGASNKPFEYLARGLALLVGRQPGWQETFVAPGYARACEPSSAESIARELQWFAEHPQEAAAMGDAGRKRILDEWNYERSFEPVLSRLTAHA